MNNDFNRSVRRAVFLIFLLITVSTECFAQEKGIFRGFVTDSTNGEALAYGNVLVKELNTGASTDKRGFFYVGKIPAGRTYTISVSYVGYRSKEVEVSISANKITEINIQLVPMEVELQEVEKTAKRTIRENEADIGLRRITMREIEKIPSGVEADIFRSLKYLPGISSTGDVSSRYYVRGGGSDQNLVLLDGVTMYNPFHALGMFSAIDPEMINNIKFYKGGFPADYGGRISSVLHLVTKDGNKNRFAGKFTASYLTNKALVEGPFPNGSFIVTGRKSYSTGILKKFLNNTNAPFDFYDLSFKVNTSNNSVTPGTKITALGFLSEDKLINDDPLQEDLKWSNNIFAAKWFQVYDSPLYSEFTLSLSKFSGEIIPKLSGVKKRDNSVEDFTLDMKFTYVQESKDELLAGYKFQGIKSNLFLERNNNVAAEVSDQGARFNVFGKYKLLRFDKFGADIGSRINVIGLTSRGNMFFEPRTRLTYQPIPQIAFKGAWGIFLQEMATVTDESEILSLYEPWIIIPDYLDPPKAIHYSLGLETKPLSNLSLNAEGYYKVMDNLMSFNEEKSTPATPDFISASGESYGFEFLLEYIQSKVNFRGSYTLSWAYKEANDWLYYAGYDTRHSVNLMLDFKLPGDWKISAMWNYHSGLPFTPSSGFYNKLVIENLHSENIIRQYYAKQLLLGDKYIKRLPDYHRLDISVSKRFEIGFAKFDLKFSILNVYDRANLFYFKRDDGERVNMLPFLPTGTITVEL